MTRKLLGHILALAWCLSILGPSEASYAQAATGSRHISVVAPGFATDSEEAGAFREGLRTCWRPRGRWAGPDAWAPGWQHHWSYQYVCRVGGQAPPTAQGSRTIRQASRRALES